MDVRNFLDGVVRQSGGSGRRPVQPDGTSGAGRPSLSCPRREGVLLAAGGGERIWHFKDNNEVGSVVSTCFWSTALLDIIHDKHAKKSCT